ncbi:ABC transporter permease, partial [Hymenobacter agri]
MLLSYLKIAWKVLQRRKFFTFISLFGISFTLMILLVVYALFDYTVGPQMPEKRLDRLLFSSEMVIQGEGTENMGRPSFSFLEHHIRPLRTPEAVSISSGPGTVVSYVGNAKLKLDQRYTDAEFWQMLDFDFVEGRPYNAAEQRAGALVTVLNESTARRYFGTARGVVGRSIVADEVRYKVVGVVRDVPAARRFTYAEVWMPLSTSPANIHDSEYMGWCQAIL